MRTALATAVALSALALTGTSAQAWHRHHHGWGHRYLTIGRAGPATLPGYHCPLGQWWRPSLGVCQGTPYGGERMTAMPDGPTGPEPRARPAPDLPPVQAATSGRRVVDTDTRVVGRQRRVTRDGVLVIYEVRTRVTERYPSR